MIWTFKVILSCVCALITVTVTCVVVLRDLLSDEQEERELYQVDCVDCRPPGADHSVPTFKKWKEAEK